MKEIKGKMSLIQETMPLVESLMKHLTREYNYLVEHLVICEQIQTIGVPKGDFQANEFETYQRNQLDLLDDSKTLKCLHITHEVLASCESIKENLVQLLSLSSLN